MLAELVDAPLAMLDSALEELALLLELDELMKLYPFLNQQELDCV